MKILIVHLGRLAQLLPATSILRGLLRKKSDLNITWVLESEENKYIFDYNKSVNRVIYFSKLKKIDETFDLLINLYPKFPHYNCKDLKIKSAFDYDFNDEFKNFVDIIYGKESFPINIFQLYYKLSGLTWKGEGYDIGYYPRTRSKKNRIGMAVAHANLRNYIMDEIDLENKKIWHIPYKKNIFRKMDEINRCKKIITDDLTTFHLAMALNKYVYFLQLFPSSIKIELFGNGQVFQVPSDILQ